MENSCQKHIEQIKKTNETIYNLESELFDIRLKLKNNPNDTIYLREYKRINLDMTITLNELEDCQVALEKCININSNYDESKYND